ncbi:hypothetical protein BC629DRAFT_611801 [Irpex lacteus]|nr:hypothetical protein BC629DRAFT_611801 [Irpex lacteus]
MPFVLVYFLASTTPSGRVPRCSRDGASKARSTCHRSSTGKTLKHSKLSRYRWQYLQAQSYNRSNIWEKSLRCENSGSGQFTPLFGVFQRIVHGRRGSTVQLTSLCTVQFRVESVALYKILTRTITPRRRDRPLSYSCSSSQLRSVKVPHR